MKRLLLIAGFLSLGMVSTWAALTYAPQPAHADGPTRSPTEFGLPASATENTSRRTKDSKTYDLPGGHHALVMQQGLHYQKSAGVYVDPESAFGASTNADTAALVVTNGAQYRLRLNSRTGTLIDYVLPSGSYTQAGNHLTYSDDGLTWTYTKISTGLKLAATVFEARGQHTYTFPYFAFAPLTVLASGDIRGNGFTLPAPIVRSATGATTTYPWSLSSGMMSFSFNDTGIGLPYTIDPSVTLSPSAPAQPQDGYVRGRATGAPPTTCTADDTTSATISTQKGLSGGDYFYDIGVVHWSLANLTEGAIVTAAEVRVYVNSKAQNDAALTWRADWYNISNNIDCTQPYWIATPDGATWGLAFSGVDTSTLTTGAYNTVALTNLSNLQQFYTGANYVGMRFGYNNSAPTGDNSVIFQSFDGANPPLLVVTYDEITVTSVNESPVAANGTKSLTINGTNLSNATAVRLTPDIAGPPNINCTNLVVVSSIKVTADCNVNGATGGLWSMRVADSSTALSVGDNVLSIHALSLASVSPVSGSTGVQAMTLAGDGFDTGAQVVMQKSGETDITCTGETVGSLTSMTANCNITGATAGAWDVRVTNTGSSTSVKLSTFLIIAGALVLQADNVPSGHYIMTITRTANGVTLSLNNSIVASTTTTPTVVDNASDWTLFLNSVMPYVDSLRLTVSNNLVWWWELNKLPDYQLDDRSGQNHNATAYYPNTISGYSTSILPLEPTGTTVSTNNPNADFIGDMPRLPGSVANEKNTSPGDKYLGLFALLKFAADTTAIPYDGFLIFFAFLIVVAAAIGSWVAFQTVHFTWAAILIASIVFAPLSGNAIWGWMVPISFGLITVMYIFWRRASV